MEAVVERDEVTGLDSNPETEFYSVTNEEQGFFVTHKEGVIGFAIGAAVAGSIGLGAWFYERSLRKKLLRQIDLTMSAMMQAADYFENVANVPDKVIRTKWFGFKKEEVEVSRFHVMTIADLHHQITDNMIGKRLGRKEREAWNRALNNLVGIAAKVVSDDFKKKVAHDRNQNIA